MKYITEAEFNDLRKANPEEAWCDWWSPRLDGLDPALPASEVECKRTRGHDDPHAVLFWSPDELRYASWLSDESSPPTPPPKEAV